MRQQPVLAAAKFPGKHAVQRLCGCVGCAKVLRGPRRTTAGPAVLPADWPSRYICLFIRTAVCLNQRVADKKVKKTGFGWMHLLWLAAVTLLGMAMVPPCLCVVYDKSYQEENLWRCRTIVVALKMYSAEHAGRYPDADSSLPVTANQAFRILVRDDVFTDERAFGVMAGFYAPDQDIGQAPDFQEALQSGENHWAMTKGATEKSPPVLPLIFENAVSNGWPPTWNVDAAREKKPGRAWKGGKIIVGFNDGSAQLINLESSRGTSVGPKKGADGKDVFTRASASMEILDIER